MEFSHFLTSYMPDPSIGFKQHFQNMIDQAILAEKFFEQMLSLNGVRLPGQRRHTNRLSNEPRNINKELVEKIKELFS